MPIVSAAPADYRRKIKTCERCKHVWYSHSESPVRCPGCGTYHWNETPTVNACTMCGHEWFSRTDQTPLRCPACKTRSWKGGDRRVRHAAPNAFSNDDSVSRIMDMYISGEGCISIAKTTGVALSKVVRVIRSEISDGRSPRM